MRTCRKTSKRIILLDSIADVIMDKDIYDTIDYKMKDESFIKQFMYQPLISSLVSKYKGLGCSDGKAISKAKESLVWEANKQTTLHNMVLFGTQHRPDMEINFDNVSIAVEVKKGNNGSDIRQGIGQSIIYSTKYNFVLFLFIDTTDDKRILNSVFSMKESFMLESLWDNYNIMFKIV